MIQDCLTIRRRLGDQVGEAAALNILGDVALDRGDNQQARQYFEASLACRHAMGETYGSIDDLRGLSQVDMQENRLSQARSRLEEALALSRQLNLTRIEAAVLRDLSIVCLYSEDPVQSLTFAHGSFDLSKSQNDTRGTVESLEVLADIAQKSGQLPAAAQLMACAATYRQAKGMIRPPREQARVSQMMQAIQESLGPGAFILSWEAGRRLSADQAVEQGISLVQTGLGV